MWVGLTSSLVTQKTELLWVSWNKESWDTDVDETALAAHRPSFTNDEKLGSSFSQLVYSQTRLYILARCHYRYLKNSCNLQSKNVRYVKVWCDRIMTVCLNLWPRPHSFWNYSLTPSWPLRSVGFDSLTLEDKWAGTTVQSVLSERIHHFYVWNHWQIRHWKTTELGWEEACSIFDMRWRKCIFILTEK